MTKYHGVGAMAAVKGSNKRRNTWSPKVNQEGQTDLVEYLEQQDAEKIVDVDTSEIELRMLAHHMNTEEVLTSAMDGAMEKLFGIAK